MPMSYPDGWQLVLEISQPFPNRYLLTDRGKTLSWLEMEGQNMQTEVVKIHLQRFCLEHSIEEEKGVFQRFFEGPPDSEEIHVFAEGLIAISRLEILADRRPAEEDVASQVIGRTFQDAKLVPKRNHRLPVSADRTIAVD